MKSECSQIHLNYCTNLTFSGLHPDCIRGGFHTQVSNGVSKEKKQYSFQEDVAPTLLMNSQHVRYSVFVQI